MIYKNISPRRPRVKKGSKSSRYLKIVPTQQKLREKCASKMALPDWVVQSLRESGIYELRAKLRIEYSPPDKTDAEIEQLLDTYKIPYFDLDGGPSGFVRYRLSETLSGGQKYTQRTGSGCHLYLAPILKDTSWREIAQDATKPIWITEGEKKAARACKAGLPTIGLGGVSSWATRGSNRTEKRKLISDFNLFEWSGRPVYIVFDSDQSTKGEVKEEQLKLCAALRDELGTDLPRIVELKPLVGGKKCGLDDFFEAAESDEQAIRELQSWARPVDAANLAFAQLNDRYIKHTTSGRIFDKQELKFISYRPFVDVATAQLEIDSWDNGQLKRIPAGALWVRSGVARATDRLTYFPGRPELLDEGYNLWSPQVVPRAIDGEVRPFYDLLDHLGIAGALRDQFLAWCAWPIVNAERIAQFSAAGQSQIPDNVKVFWAVVLTGPQRTGKTFLGEILGAAYDTGFQSEIYTNATHLKNSDDLTARFNSRLAAKQFVLADEIMTGDRREVANTLKSAITSLSIDIEPKGVDVYTLPNRANFFLTSNSVAPIWYEDGESRYFHHKVDVDRLEKKKQLRRKLQIWHNEKRLSGPNLRYHFLHDREIKRLLKNFDPRACPMETESLAEAREATHTDIEAALEKLRLDPSLAWRKLLSAGSPCKLWTLDMLLSVVDRIANLPSPKGLQFQFRNARVKPYINLGQVMLRDGSRTRLWAHVNDAPKLKKMRAEELAELWEKEQQVRDESRNLPNG
jgi:hypothetical protein